VDLRKNSGELHCNLVDLYCKSVEICSSGCAFLTSLWFIVMAAGLVNSLGLWVVTMTNDLLLNRLLRPATTNPASLSICALAIIAYAIAALTASLHLLSHPVGLM
jgi:hypothetical protein